MELFSKEAVEAVESLNKELQTVKTQISQVGDEWLYLSSSERAEQLLCCFKVAGYSVRHFPAIVL